MYKYLIYYILFYGLCLVASGCETQINEVKDNHHDFTEIKFADTILDLGSIKQHSVYPISFGFTNCGSKPLIIKKVESTCGSTVVNQRTLHPIKPGMSDSITGTIKPTEESGLIEKKIYLLTNTQRQFYVLRIKARIEK